jgi:hypothetical protein
LVASGRVDNDENLTLWRACGAILYVVEVFSEGLTKTVVAVANVLEDKARQPK